MIGLGAIAGLAPIRAAGLDPANMGADEIKALEQRLTDAACYNGAIDGQPSPALDDAIKACPNQRPFLRVETGMHTDQIKGLSADARCRILSTVSFDKTVRLWSLPDGRLLRVLRLPIGDGRSGQLFATAVSPDGRLLAVARADHFFVDDPGSAAVYLYDIHNPRQPRLVRRMAFGSRPLTFAFSDNGNRLAIGFKGPKAGGVSPGTQGVRVVDISSGGEVLSDPEYEADVNGLAFAPDGSLVASSWDGRLRRYEPDMRISVKRDAPEGGKPNDVEIDPSGRLTAIGYYDQTAISMLDTTTLNLLFKADLSDLSAGDLGDLAWSSDGATLLASGQARAPLDQKREGALLRRFDLSGQRSAPDIVVPGSGAAVARCGEGFVFEADDPTVFGLISTQGVTTTLQGPSAAAMRGKVGSAFTLSPDASAVRFGLGEGDDGAVIFDLTAPSLVDSPTIPSNFVSPRIDGLSITDWLFSMEPKLRGARLPLEVNEKSQALAIRPDLSGFVLGTYWNVRAYNSSGEQLWAHVGQGLASGVNFSADGDIVVVAYSDGTIRWLRWSDGQELLALFVEPKSRKWVVWTPSGYYLASAGAEDMIGWNVNRGWEQEADFFPASQFRTEYNRPDIVGLMLQTKDETEAVRRANAANDRAIPARPVATALPPIVSIVSPEGGSHFTSDSVEIAFSLRSPSGLPVDKVDVLADGEPVTATGFEKTAGPEGNGRVVASLPRKDTTVSLIAHSGDLTSAPVSVRLEYYGPSPAELSKPKLYALLVGVTHYANPDYNDIIYSGHDAEEFAAALMAQKGGLYADVQVRLVDSPGGAGSDPTRANVENGFYWLQNAATNRDLAVIFLAGHGFLDAKQKFWFLTREADISKLRTTAISTDDLRDLIESIPGKKVLFIDACHSGAATVGYRTPVGGTAFNMHQVVNDFSQVGSGVVVYAASTGAEWAQEKFEWGQHGAFTKALIEAIGTGKAAIGPSGRITTDMLDLYVEERVKALTAGQQHPVMNRPEVLPDFPIAVASP